jgi:3-hydroxy-9,10-secoandrosta-1,3,5(10)-triene-9,17-dione monooxygenase reductase component
MIVRAAPARIGVAELDLNGWDWRNRMSNDIDQAKRFRQALGSFVTGVTIVTTIDADGRPVGLTANSFNSVSLDPPMVLFSLALSSNALPAFRDSSGWAVHILAADQEDLSSRFATRGAEKFAGLDYTAGPDGVPLLGDCAARFVCRATFEYEGGDHAIFVGEVVDFTISERQPLIYHSGRYSRVMPSLPPPVPGDLEAGEFGRHFIGHVLGAAYNAAMKNVRHEYRARGLRGAEYSVIAALGLGEGCSRQTLFDRLSNMGVSLPGHAIDALVTRGLIVEVDGLLSLTDEGRRVLIELVAVAQDTQLRKEEQLSEHELRLLYDLLKRIA